MIGRMDPSTSSVAFQNVPSAPPPAYSASNAKGAHDVNSQFHVSHPVMDGENQQNLAEPRHSHGHVPLQHHPQYGE